MPTSNDQSSQTDTPLSSDTQKQVQETSTPTDEKKDPTGSGTNVTKSEEVKQVKPEDFLNPPTEDKEPEIDEEDAKTIDSRVKQRLVPMERRMEVQNFLSSDEGKNYKQYAPTLEKIYTEPSLKGLNTKGLELIAKGLDYENAMKRGAEAERKAQQEAKEGSTGGGSSRSLNITGKSAWEMSPEEFAKMQLDVASGKYQK